MGNWVLDIKIESDYNLDISVNEIQDDVIDLTLAFGTVFKGDTGEPAIILENGNFGIYNNISKEYEDSGVKAQGIQGDTYISVPRIENNELIFEFQKQ